MVQAVPKFCQPHPLGITHLTKTLPCAPEPSSQFNGNLAKTASRSKSGDSAGKGPSNGLLKTVLNVACSRRPHGDFATPGSRHHFVTGPLPRRRLIHTVAGIRFTM